jgi:hypothetical protein
MVQFRGVVQSAGRAVQAVHRTHGEVVILEGHHNVPGTVTRTALAFEPEEAYRLGHLLIAEAREILVDRGRKLRGEVL